MKVFAKLLIQNILSRVPLGERVNLWMQMNITKGLPVDNETLLSKIEAANFHLDNYIKYNKDVNNDLTKISSFEFGAGYDLVVQLIFSFRKLNKVYCVDIKNKVSAFLLNDIVERLPDVKNITGLNINFDSIHAFPSTNLQSFLEKNYNIIYKAPMDAGKTNLPDESIDLFVSNATMKHVPKDSLRNILKEAFRLLKPGGVLSHSIDYKDHWAYTDSALSYYDFLQYSEKECEYKNPDLNYQNRLRHRDYKELFLSAGFKIQFEDPYYPSEKDKEDLSNLKIHEEFSSKYTFEELSILSSFFVLTK